LETLLVQLLPPIRRAGLRSVKNAHLLSFEDYVDKGLPFSYSSSINLKLINFISSTALDKTGLQVDQTALNSVQIQACLSQSKAVVAFYSLRLLLAPIVETVIQLDRLLYLSENGIQKTIFLSVTKECSVFTE